MNIPMDQLRESGIVQAWLKEGEKVGLEEGLEQGLEQGRAAAVYEMVRRAAARFFPERVIGEELERITDLESLEDLCLTMYELPNVEAVRERLNALQPKDE